MRCRQRELLCSHFQTRKESRGAGGVGPSQRADTRRNEVIPLKDNCEPEGREPPASIFLPDSLPACRASQYPVFAECYGNGVVFFICFSICHAELYRDEDSISSEILELRRK